MKINNTYAKLDTRLFHKQVPKPLTNPQAGHFNTALSDKLGLDANYWQENWVDIISGNHMPEGFDPLAMAYAGHQFGVWAGQLGDGRGLLLAQVVDTNGKLQDLHLKGAGKTPYSRMGDGNAVLRSVIREYLAGHALNALGVESSDALGFVYSEEQVQRERLEPRAAMLRVADSHIRLGHFEWVNSYAPDLLDTFTQHVLRTHYPECLEAEQPILELAKKVVENTAKTIAGWQLVGFGHGVMNTDNLSITGATIDFGPFAFIERFDPTWIFNHTDARGRYTYQNQPAIAHWNLSKWLGQLLRLSSLKPSAPDQKAITKADLAAVLDNYESLFLQHYKAGLAKKVGLELNEQTIDWVKSWLQFLQDAQLDYTNSFRALCDIQNDFKTLNQTNAVQALFNNSTKEELAAFEALFSKRLNDLMDTYQQLINTCCLENSIEVMQSVNPIYILRTSMAQHAIAQAEQGDFDEVHRLFKLLSNPYNEQDIALPSDTQPPKKDEIMPALSCSS